MALPESALKGRNARVLAIIARSKMNCISKGERRLRFMVEYAPIDKEKQDRKEGRHLNQSHE
jgi:hypothetical protein